ncbi:MAG: response regulator, partial [Deltaproteobacteria bacterium]|nr:response regulator [Deltaproteobacteria bacterium]
MSGRKVLIVEDHQSSREGLAIALKSSGFEMLQAGSRKDALPLLVDGQLAAVISEFKLPDGNGLDLLAQLKKSGLDRPVIFVTAYGTMSSAIQAMKMGAADFLVKPVTAKDITDALTSAIKKRDLVRAKEGLESALAPSQP